MSSLLTQIIFIVLILALGLAILIIRRKAEGNKSLYKLFLILIGIFLSLYIFNNTLFSKFSSNFLEVVFQILLIVLSFELMLRFDLEALNRSKIPKLFYFLLIINIIILTLISGVIMDLPLIYILALSVIISSVEYFTIDEIKIEGDIINPIIIFFIFTISAINNFAYTNSTNVLNIIVYLIQYLFIGVGVGVIGAIITLKIIDPKRIDWMHQIGLLCIAIILYILTERVGGSGILAVMIVGYFFAKSHVKQKSTMLSFRPFIFKNLEILIYMFLGIATGYVLSSTSGATISKSAFIGLILFIIYIVLRFITTCILYRRYSLFNKLIFSLAPKGLTFSSIMLAFFLVFPNTVILASVVMIVISLIASAVMERVETKKHEYTEKLFYIYQNIRYGRKLFRRR